MAAAAATFTSNKFPKGHTDTLDTRILLGTIAIDASPATYTTNGVPLTSKSAQVGSGQTPFFGKIYGVAGYQYVYDPTNDTVRIYQQDGTTGALAEIANGVAIAAGISGDTIQAALWVKRS